MVILICGVAGVGKTTIGKLLASELGWRFYEADDFHSRANIDKMRSGQPLTDEDRQAWLEKLRQVVERSLAANENAILACSSLKRKYREPLRVSAEVKFVFLRGTRARIAKQLKERRGHFAGLALLDSQLRDLQEPNASENAVTIQLRGDPSDLVHEIETKLGLK
jgi:gluconokinase